MRSFTTMCEGTDVQPTVFLTELAAESVWVFLQVMVPVGESTHGSGQLTLHELQCRLVGRDHVGAVGPLGAPRGNRALMSFKLLEIKNLTFISKENIFRACSVTPT